MAGVHRLVRGRQRRVSRVLAFSLHRVTQARSLDVCFHAFRARRSFFDREEDNERTSRISLQDWRGVVFFTYAQMTATANHALQRTAPCVTAPASAAALPPAMQVPRRTPRSLSLGSLDVNRRAIVMLLLSLIVAARASALDRRDYLIRGEREKDSYERAVEQILPQGWDKDVVLRFVHIPPFEKELV